jgi:hypothetical protein
LAHGWGFYSLFGFATSVQEVLSYGGSMLFGDRSPREVALIDNWYYYLICQPTGFSAVMVA